MPEIDALVMQVFRAEVLKTAGLNTRMGAGAVLGVLGAAGGAGAGYLRNRMSGDPEAGSPLGLPLEERSLGASAARDWGPRCPRPRVAPSPASGSVRLMG